ncbi:FecR domain-containing protein [uncultured Proteiniphilum sp.]|uniref:FecR family protein n=1 Tax=uncultured Proteiniphilum sp. TaxID=497637 RepID=UPI0026227141|nr:FecR domain-containing protein [uncultured Proteiniphilum sp.]
MQLKTNDNNFVRFLKDEKFIEWKLLPTDELNVYWEEYLQQHPHEKEDILQAEKHLQRINVTSFKLPPEKRREAILRLEQSLAAYNRKRMIRRFVYAAACAAVLVLSILYIQKEIKQSGQELIASTDYIVGSELESEDILFITGNSTASFQSNVDIQIDGNKTAQIKSEGKEAEEISIEQHTMNKLIVPYGKRSRITLADGTQVWLNSGSTMEFPSAFTENAREIHLSGEMYIEVAPDKNRSFYVYTSGYNVKVYGTKFNVSSYSGSPSSVVLVEGSVSLRSADKQELFLSPNEQAVYSDNGTFHTQKVDVTPFISWKDGYLTFEDTPVTQALKQIERYYNLSFNYGDDVSLQGLTCTGKIILSDNLDNVMTALTLISATKYKKEDKLIYIYKE